MKKTVKFLPVIAIILAVMAFFYGCNRDKVPDAAPPETEQLTYDLTSYKIVRPERASKLCIRAAQKLKSGLDRAYASGIGISDDWVKMDEDIPADGFEILIGATNRAKSAYARELTGGEMRFVIRADGNSIVINASNDILLDYAVDYFLDSCASGAESEQSICLSVGLEYISGAYPEYKIVENGNPAYHIMYDGGLNDAITSVYTSVKSSIDSIAGNKKQTCSNDMLRRYDVNAREILIGNTKCAQTAECMERLKPNQYGIFAEGNKIVVCGRTREGDALAVAKFRELLQAGTVKNKDGSVSTSVCIGSEGLIYTNEKYDFGIPSYTYSRLSYAYDCGDDVLAEYYTGAEYVDYENYCNDLTSGNFGNLYTEVMGDVTYSAYQNDSARVFVSYTENDGGLVGIISEDADRPFIPPVNTDAAPVCDISVTQLALSYIAASATNGMGYILRLGDGSFVIWDGGFDADAQTVMQALEKLSVTKEKTVIRAWIITHMHIDHYSAFRQFAKSFADRVKLEYLIVNVPDRYYDPKYSNVYANGNIADDVLSFSGAKMVKIHAGTVLHFSGADIEFLMTHEELYRDNIDLEYVNDSSVISRFIAKGQKMIFPGDAQKLAVDRLVSLYGRYLESDFVQVSHHGSIKRGATVEFYRNVNPDYAFFPGSAGRFAENKYTQANRFIITCVGGEKNVFVADGENKTLVLPVK